MENDSGNLSIEDLASQIASADQPEQPTEDSGQHEQFDSQEGAPDEALEASQDDPAPEDQPSQESSDERLVTWQTANGEAYSVTERELRDGYMRQKDYTQNTQAFANEVQQTRAALAKQGQMMQVLTAEVGEIRSLQSQLSQFQRLDWARIEAEDPNQAQSLRIRELSLRESLRAAQGSAQQKVAALQQHDMQYRQHAAREAYGYLQKHIKGFDADALQKLSTECVKAGHRQEDLEQVTNPVLALDLWKARQWDSLQAKKPEVTNKVRGLPPPTAGRPARNTVAPSKQQEVSRALASKRNFSVGDFAALLNATR